MNVCWVIFFAVGVLFFIAIAFFLLWQRSVKKTDDDFD